MAKTYRKEIGKFVIDGVIAEDRVYDWIREIETEVFNIRHETETDYDTKFALAKLKELEAKLY